MEFYKTLITWYLQNKRSLPWRKTKDPYRIWLSEIILQQTRVEQGKPYYEAFVEKYPNVFELAGASQDEVLKLWQGLGYYSRARNMHATAQHVANNLAGDFPSTYRGLKELKGVGDYTASAIASISFDQPTAVVDGNVYRSLSRIFGIHTPIDSPAGQKEFKALAQELIDPEDPATFNQAIMEFGAIQCKPKNPYCMHCPFVEKCLAYRQNKINQLPVKKGKTKVTIQHFNYLVFLDPKGKTLLQQRTGKGIWQGLYEFPLIISKRDLTMARFRESELLQEKIGKTQIKEFLQYNELPIIHKLSHRELRVTFWIAKVDRLPRLKGIETGDPRNLAVPVVLARFIEAFDF